MRDAAAMQIEKNFEEEKARGRGNVIRLRNVELTEGINEMSQSECFLAL